jgi:hypothetical protein
MQAPPATFALKSMGLGKVRIFSRFGACPEASLQRHILLLSRAVMKNKNWFSSTAVAPIYQSIQTRVRAWEQSKGETTGRVMSPRA